MDKKSIHPSNNLTISHILAIDYGKAKVGLAMADNETRIAFAYATLDNDKNFLQNLVDIIKKQNVNKIIIGIPSYINKKTIKYEGEKLGDLIKKIFPNMKIEYQDEMFTTKIAQENLIAKGVKGVKKYDDQEAARIILQSWLDKSYKA
jgi:putative Holliday junction resolvase